MIVPALITFGIIGVEYHILVLNGLTSLRMLDI